MPVIPRPLRRPGSQAGFTLVELLVVVLLFAIVSGIVGVSVVRGLRAESQAQARIEAFEDMQIALERISRDVRGARLPLSGPDTAADEIEMDVLRDGECLRFRYRADDDGRLWVTEARSTSGCPGPFTLDEPGERLLMQDLDLDADPDSASQVFEFLNSDLQPVVTDQVVTAVRITFTRIFPGYEQQPVTVETTVGLRNAL